jgi:membrane protease YdiL (CAAX protease family)
VALGFALYLLLVVVGSIVLLAAWALHLGRGQDLARVFSPANVESIGRSLPGILLSGAASSFAGIAVAVGGAALSAQPFTARLRLLPTRGLLALSAATTVAMLGLGATSTAVSRALGVHNRGTLPILRAAMQHLSPSALALSLAIIGLAAGAGEELFFRGYLLTRFAERWRPWVGNAVVALLFAAMHLDPVHSSFAFVVGLALGWVSLRARSVLPTVVAHVVNNSLSVIGTSYDTSEDTAPLPLLFALGPMVVGASLGAVWRLTRDHTP